jgi:23S rRNA pseudouridine1911/1915/1917 synthase
MSFDRRARNEGPPNARTWTIGGDDVGLRLDKFLAAAGRSGSRLRAAAALERGKVSVNGTDVGLEAANRRLAPNDVVALWIDRPGSSKKRPRIGRSGGPLDVVYEDEALLVVNKPAGVLTVPLERRGPGSSVYELIAERFRSRGKRRPFVVHRIDQDTSGLVVFAKDADARHALQQQFKHREPGRVYLAVVYGSVRPRAGTWRDYLVWDEKALIQKPAGPKDTRGKEAVCDYRVLEDFGSACLIEVRLRTGRRNQIRAQAQLRGHPLVGEERYVTGASDPIIPFGRQALHAAQLEFGHPADGRTLTLEAPVPRDMRDLIDRLRRRSFLRIGSR